MWLVGKVLVHAVVSVGKGDSLLVVDPAREGKTEPSLTSLVGVGDALHAGGVGGLRHEGLVDHVDDAICTQVGADHLLTVYL